MFNQMIALFVCAASVLAWGEPAAAQTTGSSRPFRGALFGGNRPDDAAQRLQVSVSVVGAYDDDVFGIPGTTVNPSVRPVGGYYSMLQPAIDYRWTGRRAQVGITEASAIAYYPQLSGVRSISHSAGAGVALQFARKTTLLLNQTAAYSPSYLFGLFPHAVEAVPGGAVAAAPNYAANDTESYAYGSTARLSHGVSRRTTLAIGGDFRYTDFMHKSVVQNNLKSYGVDGQASYQRTRNTALRVGYRYRSGNLGYGTAVSTNEHGLDAGVSYSRPLSATRRAMFSFNLGSSAVSTLGASPDLQLPPRLYRAAGDATMGYQFASAWQARATYRRGLAFVPGLAQPVFTDGVTAALDGLLTRRIDFRLSAGYSQGESAISRRASRFDTYTGTARFQYVLGTSAAVHVEYLYYFYDFVGSVQLPPGASPRLQRNGVRAGLTWLLPTVRG